MDEFLYRGIGIVVPTDHLMTQETLIRIIRETTSISPTGRRDTEGVRRALYPDLKTRAIINVSSGKILERLRHPTAIMTLEVDDTREAAKTAFRIYTENGYEAEIVDSAEAEIGMPEQFMYFVLADGIVPILFWPRNPDSEMLKHIPPPEPRIED